MGDVHCVGQGLEAPRRHAPDGADQGEDAAVHQLTGLERGGGEKQEREALLSKRPGVGNALMNERLREYMNGLHGLFNHWSYRLWFLRSLRRYT